MKRSRLFLTITAAAFVIAVIILTVILWPFIRNLNDGAYREAFSARVKETGPWGIAIMFGLMVLQIIVAVIPGGPVELIAGAAYGAWKGAAICAAGSVFASVIIFLVSEKFGLPIVYRFFGKEKIQSWKFFGDTKKTAALIFILFIIPGLPKDLLTWLAPVSGFPLRRFAVLSTLGRLPAILCAAIMGDAMIRGDMVLFVVIFLLTAAAGILGIYLKDRVIATLKHKGGAKTPE